jgi:hypothetical protein
MAENDQFGTGLDTPENRDLAYKTYETGLLLDLKTVFDLIRRSGNDKPDSYFFATRAQSHPSFSFVFRDPKETGRPKTMWISDDAYINLKIEWSQEDHQLTIQDEEVQQPIVIDSAEAMETPIPSPRRHPAGVPATYLYLFSDEADNIKAKLESLPSLR